MIERQDASVALECPELLSGTLLNAFDPLTTVLVTGYDAGRIGSDIDGAVAECESGGGYVEDIKLSTAAAAYGEPRIAYTALVMCRMPSEEEETGT